jgi:hypothetical protein
MVATILVGMLCAHLLCFAAMFLLISKRLHGKKMGLDFLPWAICCWGWPMCCNWWKAGRPGV